MTCRAVGLRRMPPSREGKPRTDAEGGVCPDHCDLRRVRGGGRRCEVGRKGRKMGAPRRSAYFVPVRGKRTEAGGYAGQWVGVLRGIRGCLPSIARETNTDTEKRRAEV